MQTLQILQGQLAGFHFLISFLKPTRELIFLKPTNVNSLAGFKKEIREWKPANCPCRIVRFSDVFRE